MKRIIIILTLGFAGYSGLAQDASNQGGGASQSAVLALNNGIDIGYVATNNDVGNDAVMDFSNPNDYSNGVMSAEQRLRVRSNRGFKVGVRCDGNSFSYEGNSNITPTQMPNDALWLKVTGNNTGGSVKAPFSTNNFAALSTNSKDLLVDGKNGGNQTFSVMYKCTPGFDLPAGTYTMNVVFTATQE